ncbi:hypothetical protein HDV00_000084 [Rhizophlyctis rosea]|nr:hypothetical protein HDV00_000084 [Rhizophlyctis rosea]
MPSVRRYWEEKENGSAHDVPRMLLAQFTRQILDVLESKLIDGSVTRDNVRSWLQPDTAFWFLIKQCTADRFASALDKVAQYTHLDSLTLAKLMAIDTPYDCQPFIAYLFDRDVVTAMVAEVLQYAGITNDLLLVRHAICPPIQAAAPIPAPPHVSATAHTQFVINYIQAQLPVNPRRRQPR